MAVVSIIISAVGIVLSFVLGFPLSLIIGPYVGTAMGIIGLVTAIIARKKQRSVVANVALIISIIVTGISVVRIFTFASCMGKISGMLAGALMG
ncbi:MAG: hypothetical protein RSC25_07095 [Christensenella sp.]